MTWPKALHLLIVALLGTEAVRRLATLRRIPPP
jgi:lipase chaperone LimK